MKKVYLFLSILLIIGSLLFTFFYFKFSFFRMIESFIDIKNSGIYYISEMFKLNLNGELTVNNFTSQNYYIPFNLPATWSDFVLQIKNYFNLFFNLENFYLYAFNVLNGTNIFMQVFLLFLIVGLLTYIVKKIFLKKKCNNNNYNRISWPLKVFLVVELLFNICKYYILDFIDYIKNNKIISYMLIIIWIYNLNGIAILIEFIAYYLYFATSFNLLTLYIQVVKLLIDLTVVIDFVPFIMWLILAKIVFDYWRRNIAFKRLNHLECKNRGVINELPHANLIDGEMGAKKTTTMTDIALSKEVLFRNKAFELILKNDLKFPNFPWINLELFLREKIKAHEIYSLATCEKIVKEKLDHFFDNECIENIFDYDYERFGLIYSDELIIQSIFDVIVNYSKLYLIYITTSSLIISNYSIRLDDILMDNGNFPLWNNDFFTKNPALSEAYSRHSHIIDYDSFRLGKLMIDDNPNANMYEFGIICLTEIAKERGNRIELEGLKKLDESINQKNDGFNYWVKLIRHSCTIDNFCFCFLITDDNRVMSLAADLRELMDLIYISSCSERMLTYPFFGFEETVIELVRSKLDEIYVDHRFRRGDLTLFSYLVHKLDSILYKFQTKIINQFAFYKLVLNVEHGARVKSVKEYNYFLCFKKIYSNRFATDAYSAYFREKALKSDVGLNDLPCYKTIKASFNELSMQNSHFIKQLEKIKNGVGPETNNDKGISPGPNDEIIEIFDD